MPTTIHRSAATTLSACFLLLAGCDKAAVENPSYAGAGPVAAGLSGNLDNPAGNTAFSGGQGGSGGMVTATGGTGAIAGMTAMTGGMGGSGGMMVMMMTGGVGGGGMMTMSGGMGGGGTAGTMMTGGSGGMGGNPDDDLDEVRQVCLDTINMYRATIDGLEPLVRATAEQEMCSDNGAMMDAEAGQAHGSAGMCQLGSQNTCPGYMLGFGGPTLADTLKRCMQQMWEEGEPPVSRSACEADYTGCFLQHGHYLNMSDPRATVVGCGFYDMGDDTWWMNQNFKLSFR